jgi:hypothetical protein
MTEVEMWANASRAEGVCAALARNGFDAVCAKTAAEAADLVMKFVKPGMKIGFGGSMTIKSLGIQGKAQAAGAEILDHNAPGLGPEEKLKILRAQLTCDLFVSSVNAVTRDGFILNVDANGNRVGALTFGPSKVVVVVGANKIVGDLDEAFARLREVACPMNNKRLNRPNPCTKTGHCMDCEGPTRICRIYQILKRKPAMTDFTVIVVEEALGY